MMKQGITPACAGKTGRESKSVLC